MEYKNMIWFRELFLHFIILMSFCEAQSPVTFYVEQANQWVSKKCNEQPLLFGITGIDLNDQNMDETCTCFLFGLQSNTVELRRFEGRTWSSLRDYPFERWSRREGGALRIFIQDARVTFYLNDGQDESWNYDIRIGGAFDLRCSNDATISFTSARPPTATTAAPTSTPTTTATPTTTPTTTTTTTTTTTPTTPPPPPTTTTTTRSLLSSTALRSTTPSSSVNDSTSPTADMFTQDDNNSQLIILVVCLFAAALVVAILVVIVFLVVRKRRAQKTSDAIGAKSGDLEEDRGSSGFHSSSALVAMEMEENHVENPHNENTKSSIQTSPKVSMDTDPEHRVDDDSANESQTTEGDSSAPASPTFPHDSISKATDGQSLHEEDVEFVGKKVKGFRKVKKHKSRRNTILHKNTSGTDSDGTSLKLQHQQANSDNGYVELDEQRPISESQYADIDLKSLASREPRPADTAEDTSHLVYADIDFS